MSAKDLKCVDCKKGRHKDRYSGFCDWNTTNFTIPEAERTADNPKIRAPQQQPNGNSAPSHYDKLA